MTSQQMNIIAPLASPLPPPPEGDVLTPSQWISLMAIGDTVIPSLELSPLSIAKLKATLPPGADIEMISAYLSEQASNTPGLKDLIHRTLHDFIRQDAQKGISVVLTALDTRAGCLLTTGSTTSFHLQPVTVRQQILQNWTQSYLPPLRQIAKALSFLFKSVWIKQSPTLGRVLGFPRAPVHGKPGKGFNYEFIKFPPGLEPEVIDTDVVIVGSGCGAGVCAKNLAEDGHRVIVIERAYHYPPEHLPMSESDAGVHLFQDGGVSGSDDNSMSIVAGQVWGGGGTVNWSASLQTQGYVRKEWSDGGLPFFTSSEYQNSLDRVCSRMGVSTEYIEHNKTNRVLMEGARKLGYSVKAVPQNTGGAKHYCGYCTLGCGSAEKQGPVVSFLPDAGNAGAKFIEGLEVERILFEDAKASKVAVGIKGLWRSRDSNRGVGGRDRITREVIIKAKRVIVSCGALQSPLLLLRSGLKNPQIGRNLHLHPALVTGATFPEEVRPWEGGILTSVVDELQNLDGHGHGAKLEATTMLPSYFLTLQPWTSGLDFKLLCSKFKNMTGFISLARDKDTGMVYPDPVDGKCRVKYTPSALDKRHVLEGVLALAKICYVTGATEIFTTTAGLSTFVRKEHPTGEEDPGINDPHFQIWLAEVRKKGLPSPDATFCSAHQMGTCRMGSSEKTSVVDERGKVWGVEGLYVADASVFPSASGVNPMVTNMAISDWISRGVAKGLRVQGEVGAGLGVGARL